MFNATRALFGACFVISFYCLNALSANAGQSGHDLVAKLDAFMEAQDAGPLAPPSYTLAVASGNELLYSRARGTAIHGEERPLTLDTPVYIASVTKSFMGLLAAKLDADGVLPLKSTIAEAWPELKLPAPLDPSAITMLDLLSHTSGIVNDPLVIRTAYSGGTPTRDYKQILETHSTSGERTFDYENLGYLVYAAIAEQKTGKTWQRLLNDYVHTPLGLATASNMPSEIAPDVIGLGNDLSPLDRSGWRAAPAKSDDQMHPAGGHFISTYDAVRWLQAHVKRDVFEAGVYEAAHTQYARREPTKKYADMSCDGYALGWNTCSYEGHRLYYHGGTYNGMMIFMMFLPDDDLVISSINGARAMGWTFGWNTVMQALDLALELDGGADNAKRRLEGRAASQVRYLNYRVRIREAALRKATTTDAVALRQALIGSYHSDAFGNASVCETDDGKVMFAIGQFSAEVLATGANTFVLLERAYGEPGEVTVETPTNPVFEWEGGRFKRVDPNGCVGSED